MPRILLITLLAILGFGVGCKDQEIQPTDSSSNLQFYVEPKLDWLEKSITLQDGSFVGIGFQATAAVIFKISKSGELEWTQRFDGNRQTRLYDITVAENGDLIAVGSTLASSYQVPEGLSFNFVVRLNANGNTIWKKAYRDDYLEVLRQVAILSDGRIVAVGSKNDGNLSSNVILLTNDGDVEWARTRGIGPWHDYAVGVEELSSGNILVLGMASISNLSSEVGLFQPYRIELETMFGASRGEILYPELVHESYADQRYLNIYFNNSGESIHWVDTYREKTDYSYARLIKMDMDGAVMDSAELNGLGCAKAFGTSGTPDGGLFVLGATDSIDYLPGSVMPISRSMVLKLDKNGEVEWSSIVGDIATTLTAHQVAKTEDGYVVLGTSNTKDGLMLMRYKLDNQGTLKLLKE